MKTLIQHLAARLFSLWEWFRPVINSGLVCNASNLDNHFENKDSSSLTPSSPSSSTIKMNNEDLNLRLPFTVNAVIIFFDLLSIRTEISSFLNGKSGIYCWINLLTGDYYIGRGVNLKSRINNYFQPSYFRAKPNLKIVKAILKYDINNFAIVILEFTNKENLSSRENHYIKTLNPAYNVQGKKKK